MKNMGVMVILVCLIGHIIGIGISCEIGISHGMCFGYGISIGATMQNLAVLA